MARKPAAGNRVLGRRVVEFAVPRYFKNLSALSHATAITFSTISDWANGKADPRYEMLEHIANVLRREHGVALTDPLDMCRGRRALEPEPARFRNLPWWDEVVAAARKLFPKVPDYAFVWLGSLMGEEPPPREPVVIGLMAAAWYQRASDHARSDAIVAKAELEMAAEDTEHERAATKQREQDATPTARARPRPANDTARKPKVRTKKTPPGQLPLGATGAKKGRHA
jgi:transcriptional regulator with XRE-family HTH domain